MIGRADNLRASSRLLNISATIGKIFQSADHQFCPAAGLQPFPISAHMPARSGDRPLTETLAVELALGYRINALARALFHEGTRRTIAAGPLRPDPCNPSTSDDAAG